MTKETQPLELWFRGNIYTELEDAIKFSNVQMDDYLSNLTSIKWITIGSINALQCACVFFLDGNDTTQTATLRSEYRKKWFEWFDNTRLNAEIDFPKSSLASPKELYERVNEAGESENLIDEYSLRMLINIRNQFAHFYPNSISIELSGYPKILLGTWDAILKICKMPRMYQHRYPEDKFKTLVSSIEIVVAKISSIQIQKSGI